MGAVNAVFMVVGEEKRDKSSGLYYDPQHLQSFYSTSYYSHTAISAFGIMIWVECDMQQNGLLAWLGVGAGCPSLALGPGGLEAISGPTPLPDYNLQSY